MPIVAGSKMVKVCINPDLYEKLEKASKGKGNKGFSKLIVDILNKEFPSTKEEVVESSTTGGNNRPF